MKSALTFLAATFILSAMFGSLPATAEVQNVCEREMLSAAQKYRVPLGVLYAAGLNEAGRRNSLYPYALNIEGKQMFPPNLRAAKKDVLAARQRGKKQIDIGCMQLNHRYHGDKFRSLEQMLEPRANVQYTARFLKGLRQHDGSWTMAIARFRADPGNQQVKRGHVCAVIRNMVASGFGDWTKKSRRLCGA